MGFFERLKTAASAEWRAYTEHPFTEGLANGSLPEAAFRHYLVQDYLFLLAFISLSLALLNLLPLLPLDGGHIAFSLVEGVRGRPLARDVYERVSVVGIALVLMLFFVGLTNDIGRLGGG